MLVDNKSHQHLGITQQAILTTLLYSDIFSFPLTQDELWKFLITEKKLSRQEFERGLHLLRKFIVFMDGYYCLSGKEKSITQRMENLTEVEKKMRRAHVVAKKLFAIPSILFIGVSGGLAVGNVTQQDDIDFIIIVRKNTLFVSRLLILGILESLGVRRSRNQKNTADTICVNLLLDETSLAWFEKNKDIYTAREIAQIFPLFERDDIYQKFLSANAWISSFLPNVTYSRTNFKIESHLGNPPFDGASRILSRFWTYSSGHRHQNDGLLAKFTELLFINSFLESFLRFLQMSLIKRHQTKEIATKHVLAFHPNDYRVKTLEQLRLKMRQLGLLTKL